MSHERIRKDLRIDTNPEPLPEYGDEYDYESEDDWDLGAAPTYYSMLLSNSADTKPKISEKTEAKEERPEHETYDRGEKEWAMGDISPIVGSYEISQLICEMSVLKLMPDLRPSAETTEDEADTVELLKTKQSRK